MESGYSGHSVATVYASGNDRTGSMLSQAAMRAVARWRERHYPPAERAGLPNRANAADRTAAFGSPHSSFPRASQGSDMTQNPRACACIGCMLLLALYCTGCKSSPICSNGSPGEPARVQQAGIAVPGPHPVGSQAAMSPADQINDAAPGRTNSPAAGTAAVRQTSYPLAAAGRPIEAGGSDSLTAGQDELSLPLLIDEVVARNPSLQSMIATWRAAAQRYPQVVSLEDPMFNWAVAPASFDSDQVDPAYALQGSQKIPWWGKRATRGRAARAESSAAYQEVRDSRLRVIEAAQLAFVEYYLVGRLRELNDENIRAMQKFRKIAQVKYESTQVTLQDVLQADVELAELDGRRIALDRMSSVATARINTLLLRNPGDRLPAAPRQLDAAIELPPADFLRSLAIERRPDLAALGARIRAQQASLSLAYLEFYPDVEVFGRYDTFWQPANQSDLRAQVGMNVNVPLYRERRRAAVREAMFRVSQQRAEYEQRVSDIQYDVQAAYAQLQESGRINQLLIEKILPAAEQNVAAAQANYDVVKVDFLALIQAQRQLIALHERQRQANADYRRRTAELERIIGGPLPEAGTPEPIPAPNSQ
jgi:outer membrane protein TolC